MKKLNLRIFEIGNGRSTLPSMVARIPAGEPMSLSDEVDVLNLKDFLTENCPNSLMLRVEGDSMCAEIQDGDWIVVSRDVEPRIGNIVVASVNGEHTLKRLQKGDFGRRLYLVPSNGNLMPREVLPNDEFKILAVVIKIIKDAR